MSIRAQITTLLIALSILFVGTTWIVQAWVMMPAFEQLERENVYRNLDRAVDAIKGDLQNLSNLANDWGAWDDTYRFVLDRNETFRQTNLMEQTFTNTDSDFACFLDSNHKIVWGYFYDKEKASFVEVPDVMDLVQSPDSGLQSFASVDDGITGMLLTSRGPMLLASRPVITTRREAPIRGAVIFGRFIDETRIASLAERTHLDVQIGPADSKQVPADAKTSLHAKKNPGAKVLYEQNKETLYGLSELQDLRGHSAAIVRIRTPRTISNQGRTAGFAATMCSLGGGMLTLLITSFALRIRIVEPLQEMARHVSNVSETDDLSSRLNIRRIDEIGTLAESFDDMVYRLAESSIKLQEAAHRAGMSEIAADVLHNVGNAVNSANSSTQILEERLSGSKLSGLEMAAALLREEAPRAADFFTKDPRGPKLIRYLGTVSDSLQRERCENLAEVERLHKTIQHIREALESQNQKTVRSTFRQRVNVEQLLQDVLMVDSRNLREAGISVELRVDSLPELWLNRGQMTQVLINLIKNARLSMQTVPDREHKLTISAALIAERLVLRVSDTGTGISPEKLGSMFAQGFTTRSSGSGLGLHYCANVIRSLGGVISVHSDGAGNGAEFCIELPDVLVRERDPQDAESSMALIKDTLVAEGISERFQFT